MHVQLCIRKIFFCLVAPLTHRSDSKAIHKFSKFITGISFYYIQQVINPHRQRGYIINTKVFTTQQITSNEINSTQPFLGIGNACFEPQVILWDGPSIVDLETNAGLIIQAEAAYYISTRVGNHPNVRGIDTVASHKW